MENYVATAIEFWYIDHTKFCSKMLHFCSCSYRILKYLQQKFHVLELSFRFFFAPVAKIEKKIMLYKTEILIFSSAAQNDSTRISNLYSEPDLGFSTLAQSISKNLSRKQGGVTHLGMSWSSRVKSSGSNVSLTRKKSEVNRGRGRGDRAFWSWGHVSFASTVNRSSVCVLVDL